MEGFLFIYRAIRSKDRRKKEGIKSGLSSTCLTDETSLKKMKLPYLLSFKKRWTCFIFKKANHISKPNISMGNCD